MTRVVRSIYGFGIYLIVLGGVLFASPNTLLALVRLPTTTEPWIHVLGVAVLGMGMLFLASARAELTAFFRASVGVRLFAFASLIVLALVNIAPPLVAAYGLADFAGAIWTFSALRKSVAEATAI
jgi:hypothetical protein